jgi:hypothetical protein
MQSLFVTAGLAYRHRISAHQRLQDPMATFLNALTLPNLRVLNVGTRSWTGEELRVLGMIRSEWLLILEFWGLLDCYEQDHWWARHFLALNDLYLLRLCFSAKVYCSVVYNPFCVK